MVPVLLSAAAIPTSPAPARIILYRDGAGDGHAPTAWAIETAQANKAMGGGDSDYDGCYVISVAAYGRSEQA